MQGGGERDVDRVDIRALDEGVVAGLDAQGSVLQSKALRARGVAGRDGHHAHPRRPRGGLNHGRRSDARGAEEAEPQGSRRRHRRCATSSRNAAAQARGAFQLTAISLDDHDSMWST